MKTIGFLLIAFILVLILFSCNKKTTEPNESKVATPVISLPSGTYGSGTFVTISCSTDGAAIYYTDDGTTPTQSSTLYSAPIVILINQTIKAIAFKSGMTSSNMAAATYQVNQNMVAAPIFNPPSGSYTTSQSVTISCATSGAAIYFTTDGTAPSQSSTLYSAPVAVTSSMVIQAKAYKSGMTESNLGVAAYQITASTIATPTFSPAAGLYSSNQSVTISCSTPGVTIRYTTDGTIPTQNSLQYSGFISVNSSSVIIAKAFIANQESDIGYSAYAIMQNLSDLNQYEQQLNQFLDLLNWGLVFTAKKDNAQYMSLWVGFACNNKYPQVNPNDVFVLRVNGIEFPVWVGGDATNGYTPFFGNDNILFDIPLSNTVSIYFSRNGEVIFDDNVSVNPETAILTPQFPTNYNWAQPTQINWSLNSCQIQVLSLTQGNPNDYTYNWDYNFIVLDPNTRTYTIPSNSFNPQGNHWFYNIRISAFTLTARMNNVAVFLSESDIQNGY